MSNYYEDFLNVKIENAKKSEVKQENDKIKMKSKNSIGYISTLKKIVSIFIYRAR